MKRIFWVVGDKSGDLHASNVIEKSNAISSNLDHIGIGGPNMCQKGFFSLFPFEKFNMMGFGEIIKHIPFFLKVEKEIKNYFENTPPDLVVLVDYPGFNFRIAEIAYRHNIKILYYICPQFWAWRHNRIYAMRRFCDYIACIFPFEKEILDIHGVKSEYVGHPVVDEISFKINKEEFSKFFKLDPLKKWIGFFPGSRLAEVNKLLPIYVETMKNLKKMKPDYELLVSKSNIISSAVYYKYLAKLDFIHLIDGYTYEMMKYSNFLIIKSGTSTVESAYIGTPFAIVYKTSPLSYHIAKKFIRVKYIGMPNIILDKAVVPELIQNDVNPKRIIETILYHIDNLQESDHMAKNLQEIKSTFGSLSASQNVAELIKKMIE